MRCEKEEQNLPPNEERSPEKGLQKAGREQKHVFHHKFFFLKTQKQLIEAIPSMKEAYRKMCKD